MKKTISIILFSACFVSAGLAQTEISVGPRIMGWSNAEFHEVAYKGLGVQAEIGMSEKINLSLKGDVMIHNDDPFEGVLENRSVLNVQPEILFYPSGNNSGFFIGPNISYTRVDVSVDVEDQVTRPDLKAGTADIFGAGITAGIKARMGEHFSAGFNVSSNYIYDTQGEYGIRGLAGLQLGFQF